MRRTFLAATAAVALTLAVFLSWPAAQMPAQAERQPPSPPSAGGTSPIPLPITRVVLFTSGVSYFQREGQVEGSARIDLTFPVGEVNDLLKSLVVQDLGGGQISAVAYESHDPLDRVLMSFALDLTKNPPLADLLNQARGEKVEVNWQGQALQGTVVGVERKRQPAGKDQVVEIDLLNLLTAEGLRSLPLAQVQRLQLLNPVVEGELRRALEVLARARDTRRRVVTLNFTGENRREVRVGYVVESPIWKASYRLVLDQASKPLLQGWGIVDNATDDDWNRVGVTLVSGRPISFRMNLYEPLYVPRPLVELELFAGLRPLVHGGALDQAARAEARARGLAEGNEALRRAYGGLAAPGAPVKERAALDPRAGVPAGAQTQEVGDFFQYVITQPVSLARQRSAMLPIVNRPVEGTRVSIYNAAAHAKYPLLGLKFRNTTDLHLMQGPVTVFEGGSYAGDARIPNLQPKEERLISYAVDQGTEVEPVARSTPEQLIAVKAVKGILYVTHKLRDTKIYNLKNRSTHERLVLLEVPVRPDWKLVSPDKPAERSRDFYRFQVAVPPGKAASQEVIEEQGRVSQVVLSTADDQTIRLYLSSSVASPKLKAALEQAVALKVKLAASLREIETVDKQMSAIVQDQVRLRANMARVPENSAPYQRYLKKLDEQETQIERLQEQLRTLRAREQTERKEYEAFLLGLNVE
jgi:hypothetical protein